MGTLIFTDSECVCIRILTLVVGMASCLDQRGLAIISVPKF